MTDTVTTEGLPTIWEDVPVFPLPQVVLFPRATLPLHIFEQRYRDMLKDAVARGGWLVMAYITDADALDAHGHPAIARVCGVGRIVERHTLPDGRSNIVLQGVARARVDELAFVPPYRRVRARPVEERPASAAAADCRALASAATAFAGELQKRDRRFSFALPPLDDAGTLSDLCAYHLVMNPAARQAALEELDVTARVRRVLAEIAGQSAALSREGGRPLN